MGSGHGIASDAFDGNGLQVVCGFGSRNHGQFAR